MSRPRTKALLLRRERQIAAPREEEAEVIIATVGFDLVNEMNGEECESVRERGDMRAFSDEI